MGQTDEFPQIGRVVPIVDLKNQTVEYPKGSGERYIATIKDGALKPYLFDGLDTAYKSIRHGAKQSSDGPCLGKRSKDLHMEYQWMSYSEVIEASENFGAGLKSMGIPSGEESKIGIFAQNCPQWVIAEHGCFAYSMVVVPLYDTLGPDACNYVIEQGTTGPPKGAVLSHGNLAANTCCIGLMKNMKIGPKDCMISYLPLAHMFERLAELAMFTLGGQIGFFRGDVKLLVDDVKVLRPTIFPTVPRLLNRIRDKILSEVNKSAVKRKLFQCALNAKKKQLKSGIIRNDTIWDKIVFKKVRLALGGRVRFMLTGAAPCAPEVLDFCRAAFGCVVVEGYGQTESTAAMSLTLEGDSVPGHVGVPFPSCAIKLVDIPDMNYFSRNGQGEICCKGYNVFQGYFNDPKKTAETLDDEGWLHSGDVGEWTETGTLKIIDRKKHIFKLSQGEYVAPEKIENVYIQCKYIAQAFVYGDSFKSFCVGVMVPDPEVMPAAIEKELGITGSMEQLCSNDKVKAHILKDLGIQAQKAQLRGFEKVRDVFLHPELWSVENDLLTPTFKSKRPELKKFFASHIDKMYADIEGN